MTITTISCHPSDDSYHAHLRGRVLDAIGPDGDHVDVYRGGRFDGVESATDLVFVYPTWWSSLPAPLITWLAEAFAVPRPKVRTITAITTHGSGRFVNALEGGVGRRLLLTGVRSLCAPDCRGKWVPLYNVDRSTPEDRARFVERACAAVRHLAG